MMRHQYWVTKKTVLSKLGTKEDECIVASDAELDAKLELFRSISDSCLKLQRVLDNYQEQLCILAQEENSLGKFLKEAGTGPDASGKHMISVGRSISYSGQQRLSIRGPLVRLYHEVETFRGRAVSDMRATVSAMEKARTEYRAALSWMKSASSQLDPDTGRGLDSFRKAQRQVRESKKIFDKLTLDVLQKIDLLAAARCNMFSHVLSSYQTSFQTFAIKVADTLTATAETMVSPQYEFCILKELGQQLGHGDKDKAEVKDFQPRDKDQMLFFKDEYKDESPDEKKSIKPAPKEVQPTTESKQSPVNLIDTGCHDSLPAGEGTSVSSDLAGLHMDCGDMTGQFGSFLPSQLLQDLASTNLLDGPLAPSQIESTKATAPNPSTAKLPAPKKEDKAAWFKLFAELDPLANPDNLPGSNASHSHAA